MLTCVQRFTSGSRNASAANNDFLQHQMGAMSLDNSPSMGLTDPSRTRQSSLSPGTFSNFNRQSPSAALDPLGEVLGPFDGPPSISPAELFAPTTGPLPQMRNQPYQNRGPAASAPMRSAPMLPAGRVGFPPPFYNNGMPMGRFAPTHQPHMVSQPEPQTTGK